MSSVRSDTGEGTNDANRRGAGRATAHDSRRGRALRRAGLVLTVVWVLELCLAIAVRADAAGEAAGAALVVARAVDSTWGWLAAAVAIYLAGVHVGLRAERPAQARFLVVSRPDARAGSRGIQLVPVLVVVATVVWLLVAIFQQSQRRATQSDSVEISSAVPAAAAATDAVGERG